MRDPPGATERLGSLVEAAQWADLPEPVRRHALRALINVVGCALGGSRHPILEQMERGLLVPASDGRAIVLGRLARVTPRSAALLNAMSASVHAFDDTHAKSMIHPGSPVACALLAAVDVDAREIPGSDFLLAFALGLEVACRLSLAIAPATGVLPWSESGLAGSVGAAAACAKLLCSGAGVITTGLGIAASLASGLRVAHGTMTMHLVPAQAAALGLEAALLARTGFSGPLNALEGRNGLFAVVGARTSNHEVLAEWGVRYELLHDMFKAYPCGIVVHPAIDACLLARQQPGFRAHDIVEVELSVCTSAAELADRVDPHTAFEAQVSLQHWAAAALIHGKVGIEHLQPAAIDDPAIAALRRRCRVKPSSELGVDAARVRVLLRDGRVETHRIEHCRGSERSPLDDAALEAKFMDLAVPTITAESARALLDRLWSLPECSDVRRVWYE